MAIQNKTIFLFGLFSHSKGPRLELNQASSIGIVVTAVAYSQQQLSQRNRKRRGAMSLTAPTHPSSCPAPWAWNRSSSPMAHHCA